MRPYSFISSNRNWNLRHIYTFLFADNKAVRCKMCAFQAYLLILFEWNNFDWTLVMAFPEPTLIPSKRVAKSSVNSGGVMAWHNASYRVRVSVNKPNTFTAACKCHKSKNVRESMVIFQTTTNSTQAKKIMKSPV